MRKLFSQSLRALFVFTLITGVFYPLLVTGVAQTFFAKQANGTLIEMNRKIIGSELLAQKFQAANYFWPRPSANDYNAVPGGASNLGPTSLKLKGRVEESMKSFNVAHDNNLKPYDLLLTSGSGLDPHVTPETAAFQVTRVAEARKMSPEKLSELIESITEKPFLGLIGKSRVNVLKLNLALDQLER